MKAVVLAGGYATRMWPITKHRPKMFLPIGESTVIDRIFAELEADDRIDEVYVSTNQRFAPDFEAHLADSEFDKPRLSVEETTEEDDKFGVVGALAQLIDRENVDDDLLVIAGDNLISFAVSDFLDYFEDHDAPTLAAYDVGSREKAKSYGLVELEGDRVVDFQEKPDDPKSTLVSIACYAFPASRWICSRPTSRTATTPTSRVGSSSGCRIARPPTPTPSRARGTTSAPPRAISTPSPGTSTASHSSPTR